MISVIVLLASGIGLQVPVQDVTPTIGVEASSERVSLSVGGSFRPIGNTRALQLLAAKQLSSGIGAMALRAVTSRPTTVSIEDDDRIAIEVELYSLGTRPGGSYLEANEADLAASLLVGDDELALLAEEIAGPDAALAVRVAFVVAGSPESRSAIGRAAVVLYSDPEVRAAAARLAASGLSAASIVGNLAYTTAPTIAKGLRAAAKAGVATLERITPNAASLTSVIRQDAERLSRQKDLATQAFQSMSAGVTKVGRRATGDITRDVSSGAAMTAARARQVTIDNAAALRRSAGSIASGTAPAVGSVYREQRDRAIADAEQIRQRAQEQAAAARDQMAARARETEARAAALRQEARARTEQLQRGLQESAARAQATAGGLADRLKKIGRP